MGYRGKVAAREKARELRLAGMRLADIADAAVLREVLGLIDGLLR